MCVCVFSLKCIVTNIILNVANYVVPRCAKKLLNVFLVIIIYIASLSLSLSLAFSISVSLSMYLHCLREICTLNVASCNRQKCAERLLT